MTDAWSVSLQDLEKKHKFWDSFYLYVTALLYEWLNVSLGLLITDQILASKPEIMLITLIPYQYYFFNLFGSKLKPKYCLIICMHFSSYFHCFILIGLGLTTTKSSQLSAKLIPVINDSSHISLLCFTYRAKKDPSPCLPSSKEASMAALYQRVPLQPKVSVTLILI